MSAQNHYRIDRNYKTSTGWQKWIEDVVGETADTWQDAIPKWIDRYWSTEEYTVVAETPSEDSRSGIIEIQFDTPQYFWAGVKIGVKFKAILIED